MKKIITAFAFCFLCGECFSQAGEWTWMNGSDTLYSLGHYGIQGVADSLNSPPGLYEPCEWKDQQGNFWLFGGFHGNMVPDPLVGDLNDLWKYDPVPNEWTWIKGPGIPNNLGNYGVQGIPSPLNNPACRGWGTPTWSGINNTLWIYSGDIGYNDLWKYDIASNEWTWMHGSISGGAFNYVPPVFGTYQVPSPLNTPGTRLETSASWTDNNGNLWLFGGGSNDSVGNILIHNDLWKYDISTNQWAWMKGPNLPNDTHGFYGIKGIANPNNVPSARCAYAKWKDLAGNFYLFGGFFMDISGTGCYLRTYNDVWKYEINSNNWIWISGDSTYNSVGAFPVLCLTNPTTQPPSNFENRAICYDSLGNVFMFGGIGSVCNNYTNARNILYSFNTILNEWTIIKYELSIHFGIKGVSAPNNAPPKKFGSVAWWKDDVVWVFGGSRNGNSESFNDLWKFSIDYSCIPLDKTENNFPNQFQTFPNPTNSSFTISLQSSTKQTIELGIYNTLGKQIYVEKEEITKGKFEKEINVEKWSDGIYFLQVKMKEGNMSRKVIVNH